MPYTLNENPEDDKIWGNQMKIASDILKMTSLDCAVFGTCVKHLPVVVDCTYAQILAWPRTNRKDYRTFECNPSEQRDMNRSRLLGARWSESPVIVFCRYDLPETWQEKEQIVDIEMVDLSTIVPPSYQWTIPTTHET